MHGYFFVQSIDSITEGEIVIRASVKPLRPPSPSPQHCTVRADKVALIDLQLQQLLTVPRERLSSPTPLFPFAAQQGGRLLVGLERSAAGINALIKAQ